MTDDDSSARDLWWFALRRAFKIPKIVSDEVAFDVVAFETADLVERPHDFDPLPVAKALIDALLELLGASGDLDEIFFDQERAAFIRDRLASDSYYPVDRVNAKAIERGQRGPQTSTSGGEWRKMTQYLLDHVTAEVTASPYETEPSSLGHPPA